MFRRVHLGLLAAFAFAVSLNMAPPAQAAPNGVIGQNVAVCDPYSPNQCARPGAVQSASTAATVTLGNTFQTLLAAKTTRQGCTIYNPLTATETLFVNFGVLASATTGNSFGISPGGSINCSNPNGSLNGQAVNVTAATNGHAFVYTVF